MDPRGLGRVEFDHINFAYRPGTPVIEDLSFVAEPGSTVISVVGDGTYVLGVPSACHLTSAMHQLPVLWVVCNNAGWAYLAIETMAECGWAGSPG